MVKIRAANVAAKRQRRASLGASGASDKDGGATAADPPQILTFADFYDWQVARNRQLLDDHSHVLLVHILERHCFPQEFKYWAPMLDRAVELLDDEAEKRYFKHHPHATHAKPDALHACGCGNPGARHVEYSHHHLRSQFVIDHKSKMDREEAGFCT